MPQPQPLKILLTGFEPFGSVKVNPSELLVRAIGVRAGSLGCEIVVCVLPTEFRRAAAKIRQLIRRHHPDAVISTGVAAGRDAICLERVALNFDDDPNPDNSGRRVSGRSVVPGGPLAYESTLPLKPLLASLAKRQIVARVSYHAGNYVCNHVFYAARHQTQLMGEGALCGFIHLPDLPPTKRKRSSTRSKPSTGMPLKQMIEAVEACIGVLKRSGKLRTAR